MKFSELPPEIIHEILIACVRARHIRRALRLRQVSRAWDMGVVTAVFASGILDVEPYAIFIEWPRYLVYRTTGSPTRRKGWPRPLFVLRRVAERLVAWRDGSGGAPGDDAVDDCIRELCTTTMKPGCAFRLESGFELPTEDTQQLDNERIGDDDDQLLQALLSVAAASNDVALVKNLLQKIHDRPGLVYKEYLGEEHLQPLFRQPLEEAAFAGHDEMVHLFLDFKSSTSSDLAVRKAKALVFYEACHGGKLSTLDIVYEPMRQEFAEWEEALVGNMDEVTDVEVFKRLWSCAEDSINAEKSEDEQTKDEILSSLLYQAAGKGAVPLIEHLLELGATPENPASSREPDQEDLSDQEDAFQKDPSYDEDPLEYAVACGHTEAVIYMLEKGFRPRDIPEIHVDDCLVGAVRWESSRMVEAILSHIDRDSPNFGKRLEASLQMAMERENERILSRLLTFGSAALNNRMIRRWIIR
ncbi:hypothetical protein PG984_005245 [Apiospora sp. TS-2023a]